MKLYKIENSEYTTCEKVVAISKWKGLDVEEIEMVKFELRDYHLEYLKGLCHCNDIELPFTFSITPECDDMLSYEVYLDESVSVAPELRNEITELIEAHLYDLQEFHSEYAEDKYDEHIQAREDERGY